MGRKGEPEIKRKISFLQSPRFRSNKNRPKGEREAKGYVLLFRTCTVRAFTSWLHPS